MGREWYTWSGRSIERGEKVSTGCMGGMLHHLNFHHILFSGSGGGGNGDGRTTHPDSADPSLECVNFSSKGVEAPRNSLELDKGKASEVDDEFYDVPVVPVQLVMSTKKKSAASSEEDERRSSQAETPRTQSVIARLMGLDGLPEPSTPSQLGFDNRKPRNVKEVEENPQKKVNKKLKSAAKKKSRELVDETTKESPPPPTTNLRKPLGSLSCNVAPGFARERRDATLCRSLPDTPRASSARPWEVDPNRYSLQENSSSSRSNNNSAGIQHEFRYQCEVAGDYSVPPHSPSVYAAKSKKKELRKHFQDENRSPKGQHYAREVVKQVKETIISQRRAVSEEILAKSKRTFRPMAEKRAAPDDMPLTPSPSPSPPPPPFVPPPAIHPQKRRDHVEAKAIAAKRESYSARFTERIKKPSPSPSPSPLLGTSAKTQQLNVARQRRVSTTKSLQLQRSDRALLLLTSAEEEKPPKPKCVGVLTLQQDPEYGYVKSILARSGILERTWGATFRSRSKSHVIDPFVFHQLEVALTFDTGALRWRWNRKLLFHLIRELLADRQTTVVGGEELLRQLWGEIRRFPAADCRVLDDIDALVEFDLPPAAAVRDLPRHPAVAAEAEEVAAAAADAVLDSLLEEAAASLLT